MIGTSGASSQHRSINAPAVALRFATACWQGHNSAHRWACGPGSGAVTDKGLLAFPIRLMQLWTLRNFSFAHSLTQIAPLVYPSVCNPAWSEHTICFCLIPIIFTTRVLDLVQAQLRASSLSAVPPGHSWGREWSPVPFLMVPGERLRPAGWGRKQRSVVKTGAGTGRDIQA